MKWIQLGLIFLTVFSVSAADFQLYKNGQPTAAVVLPGKSAYKGYTTPGFSGKVKDHILRFSKRAGYCTGKALPVSQKIQKGKNNIIVCPVESSFAEMDSFKIDFPDQQTMRITGTEYSIRFAFDYLLETGFGVRYLLQYPHWLKHPAGYDAEMSTDYPAVKNVSIPAKAYSKTPSFNFGRTYHSIFARDWKMRHTFPYGHAMAYFPYPAKKYAPDNSWPTEILPIKNGKRFVMPKFDPAKKNNFYAYNLYWQPCWSNPKSVEIAAANILELLDKGPIDPVFKAKYYHISLGVNDNGGCCECVECRKAVGGKRFDGYLNYSELYWKWVDQITRKITQKYPHIYVHCLAYREVFAPPSFKLHPNVAVQICREIFTGALSAEEKEKIEKILIQWRKKASVLLLFDYMDNYDFPKGGNLYVLPRYYIKPYAEMLRLVHKLGVRGITLESNNNLPVGGPNLYLTAKLFWDLNTDIDKELKDWCIRAVGKKAAPYLEKYYLFWQDYWMRPELRQTTWFNSISNIYMALNEGGSYTYALKKGEIKALRSTLQQVINLAGTPMQKKRALFFMRLFTITERAVQCLYSELIRPDGKVSSAEDAVLLLRSIPAASQALKELEKDPFVSKRFTGIVRMGLANLQPIRDFAAHPAVKAQMKKMIAAPGIPLLVKSQIRLLNGERFPNLLDDGSFEKGYTSASRKVTRDTAHVSDGRFSVKTYSSTVSLSSSRIKPGKAYIVMADLYMKKASTEGFLTFLTNPRRGKRNAEWYELRAVLKEGWQTVSRVIRVPPSKAKSRDCDNVNVIFWFRNYEADEPVWIDNVRLYALDSPAN